MSYRFKVIDGRWHVVSHQTKEPKRLAEASELERAIFNKFIISRKLRDGLQIFTDLKNLQNA